MEKYALGPDKLIQVRFFFFLYFIARNGVIFAVLTQNFWDAGISITAKQTESIHMKQKVRNIVVT